MKDFTDTIISVYNKPTSRKWPVSHYKSGRNIVFPCQSFKVAFYYSYQHLTGIGWCTLEVAPMAYKSRNLRYPSKKNKNKNKKLVLVSIHKRVAHQMTPSLDPIFRPHL